MSWETGISFAALALAAVVFIRQVTRDRRQDSLGREQAALQKRLAEIEQERRQEELDRRKAASIRVDYLSPGGGQPDQFVVANVGDASAHNVSLMIQVMASGENLDFPDIREQLPIEDLPGGQDFSLQFFRGLDDLPPPYKVTVTWTDERGEQQQTFPVSL